MLTRRKVLLASLFLPTTANARTLYEGQWAQVDPDIKKWYQDQLVPGTTTSCCSLADGDQVEEDIRNSKYWIRGSKFPRWTLVPDNTVLTSPNKVGHPVVWWSQESEELETVIRCYAPGAKL